MAKKSNKTEHVLNLITKGEDFQEKQDAALENTDKQFHEVQINAKDTREQEKTEPENKQIFLMNLTERLATGMVADVMRKMKICSCLVCTNDVLALALNSLTPNYVTTDSGKQYLLLNMYKAQYETDVLAALTKACVRVKASPRHE